MASTEDFADYVLEQLSEVPELGCRPMIGEYLLYSGNVLFGGIYDDQLLIKKVPENEKYEMVETLPYIGAKNPMYVVEDLSDKEKLTEIIAVTCKSIMATWPKRLLPKD